MTRPAPRPTDERETLLRQADARIRRNLEASTSGGRSYTAARGHVARTLEIPRLMQSGGLGGWKQPMVDR